MIYDNKSIQANQFFSIQQIQSFRNRVWVNTRFAIIVFLFLFVVSGYLNITIQSIVIFIALLIAFFSLKKKATIYIQKINSDTENLYVEYLNRDENNMITIPLKSAQIRKEREKTKAQGHYILKILKDDEVLLTQYSLLSWDEVNMDKVIQIFYSPHYP